MSNQRMLMVPVAIGLVAALSLAATRVARERSGRQVEISADYAEVAAAASFSGQSVPTALARLKSAGLVAVSVEEPMLRDLVEGGAITLAGGPVPGGAAGSVEVVASAGSSQGMAAVRALAARYGGLVMGTSARLPVPGVALLEAGGGIDPHAVETIREAGLVPVARPRNSVGMTAEDIDRTLGGLAQMGVKQIVFAGDQVMGFRELRGATAASLAAHNLVWGRVEFAEQKGEDKLAETILRGQPGVPSRSYLRLHSITANEMAKLAPDVIIERFRRAAQERNIRLLFVRLALTPSDDAVAANVAYLGKIVQALHDSHLAVGPAEPLQLVSPGRVRPLVIGLLGVAAPLAWLLALGGGTWSTKRWLLAWLVTAVLFAALWAVRAALYAKVVALLAAMAYPLLAGRRAWLAISTDQVTSAGRAVGLLWSTIGLTVTGGLMSAGLLGSTGYYLHHDAFAGVKLAHLVPLLGVALVVVSGWSLPGVDWAEAKRRIGQFWRNPVTAGYLLTAMVVVAVVLVMLVRSGNEGLEVSSTELRFRAILERIFVARPRTKEFLLGDPALLLAALAAWRGRRAWSGLLLLVGMIGVVGTFNTFCHLHTPLFQSLLRTFHALWLSTLIGLAAGTLLWRGSQKVRLP